MYSEQEKRASVQRANDAFLRRMLGGELTSASRPTFSEEVPTLPQYPTRPPCNGGDTGEGAQGGGREECPVQVGMPALAMVYAPRQCWRGLYTPREALQHGTQFAELDLPFLGYSKGTGGKPRN